MSIQPHNSLPTPNRATSGIEGGLRGASGFVSITRGDETQGFQNLLNTELETKIGQIPLPNLSLMYRARLKGGPQVEGMLQAKPSRSGKQEREDNSPNLETGF